MTEHAEKKGLPAPSDEDARPDAKPGDGALIGIGHAPTPPKAGRP